MRIVSPYVGGGFGSKAYTKPHHILTVMAAKMTGRPVKYALTRAQMSSLVGYRTPTIQRIRLGADERGVLTTTAHDILEQTATIDEFAEQTGLATRTMYASPNRRTTHRLVRLDVPPCTIMRAPGETPGMYGLECAMDEMAILCGLDPIEFRKRNEPDRDADNGPAVQQPRVRRMSDAGRRALRLGGSRSAAGPCGARASGSSARASPAARTRRGAPLPRRRSTSLRPESTR